MRKRRPKGIFMAKKNTTTNTEIQEVNETPTIHSPEWTDHVLSLLIDDEKIAGNPTTDGLRRIFEEILGCQLVETVSSVVQSPDPSNGQRATVVHTLKYILNDNKDIIRVSSGAADVYWGNCDKIYRNHPVAVAETRAEGRALRRALRLRKVVAAEEIAKEIEDIDGLTVSKISNNQINFIDVLAKRLDVDVQKLLVEMGLDSKNVHAVSHEDAVGIVQKLSEYQQDMSKIPDGIKSYNSSWK